MEDYESTLSELYQNLAVIEEILTEQKTNLWNFVSYSESSEEKKVIRKCAQRLTKIDKLKDEIIEIVDSKWQ